LAAPRKQNTIKKIISLIIFQQQAPAAVTVCAGLSTAQTESVFISLSDRWSHNTSRFKHKKR
jgi:hypothetical protein